MALAHPAGAGPLEDGNDAYARGNYALAMRHLRVAADRGSVQAQTTLGLMFEQGQGATVNYIEAIKWYRRAVDAGHLPAAVNLALLYSGGGGLPQNLPEAAKWLQVAADRGHAPAQSMLGFAYASGRGVTANLVRAKMWLMLAAAALPPGRERDEAVRIRDSLGEKLSPAQNEEARSLAVLWRPKGAEPPALPPPVLPAVAPAPIAAQPPAPAVQAAPIVLVTPAAVQATQATREPDRVVPEPADDSEPDEAAAEPEPPVERSGATFVDTLDLDP